MNEKSGNRIMEVVPHNPSWRNNFLNEADKIKCILKDEIVWINHIGSTSIPGIYAKPIIDILVEVKDINNIDYYNENMMEIGYIPRGEWGITGRRYFIKGLYERTHHVHIYQSDNPEIGRHLMFRDYLVAHPEEAKQYEELKKILADKYRYDVAGYNNGKDSFIKEIDRKALKWAIAKEKRTSPIRVGEKYRQGEGL